MKKQNQSVQSESVEQLVGIDDIPFKSETTEYNNAIENKAKNLYGNKFHSWNNGAKDDVSELTKYGEIIATFNANADDVLIRNMLNAYPQLIADNQKLKEHLRKMTKWAEALQADIAVNAIEYNDGTTYDVQTAADLTFDIDEANQVLNNNKS